VNISTVQWFNWGSRDFSEQLDQFYHYSTDAILLVANAPEGANFVDQYIKREGSQLPIISHWGIAGGKFVQLTGVDNIQKIDLTVLQTFSFANNDAPIAEKVIQYYRSLFDFNGQPHQIPAQVGVAHAYDLVHLLSLAVQQANSVESGHILKALESNINYNGLVKHYAPAFTSVNHDALSLDDYILSKFDENGFLLPIE